MKANRSNSMFPLQLLVLRMRHHHVVKEPEIYK
jgi:hypothetical protein